MSYLDDLKKKAQGVVNTVQNVGNAAYSGVKQLYNATQNAGQKVVNEVQNRAQNVYNAATGQTPQQAQTPQAQIPNTNPSPATQPQNPQPETNWAAEYDKVMSGGQTPTNAGGGTLQGTQPPVSNAAQSALGEGAGQWQAELDNVMAQIMGKGKFDYNMNGDAMYQQYADIYQNQANLGMQNAMAQAAALTGGYGSSYGQMVGQQAYAQQMQGLNDIGLELYDRAYAQDMAERSQLMDQYNMLAAREEKAYNRAYQEGRDKVADDQWDKTHNWQLEQFDKLYGDEGFYATESQKDRDQQTILQDDSQAHDITLQTNDQTHDKNMATQQHTWQVEEWDKMYGDLKYDKDGNIVGGGYYTKKDAQDQKNWETENEQEKDEFNKLYGYTDENGVFHEGYYATEADKERTQDQKQFDSLYGYTDENGNKVSGYYEDMADKEFNQMYGDLEYDKDGNIVGGGYQTKKDHQDQENWETKNEQDQKQFDSLYGYTDENGNKVSGYYEDMADKEFNQMYGPEGYMTKKDKQDQENWQKEYDREGEWYADAQEASKTTTKYEGEGDFNGKEVPKQLAGTNGLTTTNTNFFDDNGTFKSAAVVSAYGADGKSVDEYGKAITPSVGVGTMTYNVGGKEIKVQTGTSPYTNTVNPDAKRGVMANGYQPTHYGTQPVGDPVDGKYTVINGVEVDVYSVKKDGKNVKIAYDDANNKYIEIDSEDIEEGEPTNKPAPPPRPNTVAGGGGGGGKIVQTFK